VARNHNGHCVRGGVLTSRRTEISSGSNPDSLAFFSKRGWVPACSGKMLAYRETMEPKLPTFDKLMNPLLRALGALGGSGSVEEIYNKVVELERFSDDVLSQLHDPENSNDSEVWYRLAWARTYLKKYGLLENSKRGVWALTAKAKAVDEAWSVVLPACGGMNVMLCCIASADPRRPLWQLATASLQPIKSGTTAFGWAERGFK